MELHFNAAVLEALLKNRSYQELRDALAELNEVDIAEFLETLPPEEAVLAFRTLPKGPAAEVFAELEPETQQHIVTAATDAELAAILEDLFVDDPALSRESLHRVMELEGEVFVPAHAPAMGQAALRALAQKNLEKMDEIEALLLALCAGGASFEQLIKGVFDHYGLTLDLSQYVLVGSTLRSYLAYLADEGRLEMRFADNRLCWHSVPVDAQRKP